MDSTSISARLEWAQAQVSEITFPKFVILLFIISFLLHGVIAALFIYQPIALDDMFQYDMLARSLKEGNGFRWYSQADVEVLRPYYSQFLDIDHLPFPVNGLETTFRAPGYPFFLAFLYFIVPASARFILARLVQAGLAASLAPLTAYLAHQVGFPKGVSFLSGLCMSLYPILLFYPIGLASENLYIPLGLLSVLLVLRSVKSKSYGWLILAGVACGLTMFTRSIFTGSVLLAAIWIRFFHSSHYKAALVFILTAFGLCLPWCVRNSILMNRLAFVENSAGYNLFIGYHPQGDGGFVSKIAILPMNILNDGERDQYCMKQATSFIQQNPAEAIRRIGVRLIKWVGPEDREFFYFYSNNVIGEIPSFWLTVIYSLLVIPWAFTLIFGISGLLRVRDRKVVLLVFLFLLGYGLPHLLIIVEPRFHLAWVPILMPFSVFGWQCRKAFSFQELRNGGKIPLYAVLALIGSLFMVGLVLSLPKLILLMTAGGNQLHFSY